MSVKAIEWAATYPGLTKLERTVLKELANRYNEKDGRAWPSQARMARETGYSRSSILRGLRSLEEKGLIVRVRSFKEGSGARTSNRYFLPKYDPSAVPSTREAIIVAPKYKNASAQGPQYVDVTSLQGGGIPFVFGTALP